MTECQDKYCSPEETRQRLKTLTEHYSTQGALHNTRHFGQGYPQHVSSLRACGHSSGALAGVTPPSPAS